MLIRLLFSVASLTAALVGGVLIACSGPTIRVLEGDPTGLCSVVTPLGADVVMWVGIGLVLFAVFSIVLIWVPGTRRRRLREARRAVSLHDNLNRLGDSALDPPEVDARSTSDVLHAVRLERKVEAIEAALSTESVATREVTEQWMRLLREANALHNRDQLPSDDFKRLNTRLLDLFAPPGEPIETDGQAPLAESSRQ